MIAYDPKNWIRVLLDFPRSPIFRTLFLDVLGAWLWAALVVWVETDVFRVAVPLGPSFLSILGIILGLLLVFRTNTAYDRWWEGRRLWGQLVNVSRGLSRHLAVAPLERRARYATIMAEFPSALTSHLRRERGAGWPHLPNQVISDLHTEIRQDAEAGHLGPDALLRLAPLLQQYDDVLGGLRAHSQHAHSILLLQLRQAIRIALRFHYAVWPRDGVRLRHRDCVNVHVLCDDGT